MPRRTRVLHIVSNVDYGGMQRVITEIARRTDSARFETHVLALHFLGHFAADLKGFATLHVASPMSKASMLRPVALARDIKAIAPDVVNTHSGTWYKGSLAARLARVPLQVYTDHGRQNPDPWAFRAQDRIASRRTDVVIAVSARLAEHLSSFVAHPSRVRVLANGVDTTRYAPAEIAVTSLGRELGIAPGRQIIGSVGRLEPVKGYDVMIAAFARLVSTWSGSPQPALVLIGDGTERASLEQLARDLNVASDIHFLGWRSDIERCTNEFTIFTMSSHSEGTSMSLLEAMSCAVCPVVTDVGGNAAVLGDSLRHRLTPAADPDALASSWRNALEHAESRRQDSINARTRVVENFGLDAMVQQYEAIYASTLSRA